MFKIDKIDTFMAGVAIAATAAVFTDTGAMVGVNFVVMVYIVSKMYFVRQNKKKLTGS